MDKKAKTLNISIMASTDEDYEYDYSEDEEDYVLEDGEEDTIPDQDKPFLSRRHERDSVNPDHTQAFQMDGYPR